jgi:hypothetical protein
MDGDTTAKTMDQNANSTMKNAEISTGIHELNYQAVNSPSEPARGSFIDLMRICRIQLERKQASAHRFSTKVGLLGSSSRPMELLAAGEKVGGPFASDGAIGKNFNPDAAIGGTIHENPGKKE